ncbi:beta-lactamase family protein [Litoribacter alkaliphilus]|uniref:Beta-lactamase family protein n=1 Tax=Litoribacter ruber TaxID=702568 RepID=A0AAP2CI37_9BACT|nr:serine hydrolase domain-containing protein [Litoribacter alkaliphilus]MBS9522975.1 beta-lactamase family protein [Litoribacter alkaliphilus]
MKFYTLLLFTLFAASSSFAQDHSALEKIFEDYQGEHPGASVAIIKEGEFIYQEGFGLANLELGQKVDSKTNFRLASISKQFTTTAILQLADQDKVNLSWTLDEVFEDFPDYGKNIKIYHLLNHTSGLWDYEEFVPDTAMNHQIMDDGVLDLIRQQEKVYFLAGEEYRYSNTGYALLALIVEKYSEMSFPDYLEKNIFQPLDMSNTLAYVRGENEVFNRAYGYDKKDGNWTKRDQSSTSAVLGDGGIYSNVEDLLKWDQALYEGTVLSKELIEQTFTQGKLNNEKEINYGLGWHIKNWEGEKVMYHTGSSTSFRNIFYRIPAKNLSVIILTNRNFPNEFDMVDLAEEVVEKVRED